MANFKKMVTLILVEEIHQQAKIKALNQRISFSQYISNLIEKDLSEGGENGN